jgi:hypothetical protein
MRVAASSNRSAAQSPPAALVIAERSGPGRGGHAETQTETTGSGPGRAWGLETGTARIEHAPARKAPNYSNVSGSQMVPAVACRSGKPPKDLRVLLSGQARHGSQTMQRRRFKYLWSFVDRLRLTNEAKHLREDAENLPPGEERDTLFKRARRKTLQANALRTSKWLSSQELQPPK